MAIFVPLNHNSYGLTSHYSSSRSRRHWRSYLHQQTEESVTEADWCAALDGNLLSCNEERATALSSENLYLVAIHLDMYHAVRGGDVAFHPFEVAQRGTNLEFLVAWHSGADA